MPKLLKRLSVIAACACSVTTAASATMLNEHVTFSITGFSGGPAPSFSGGTSPTDPVTGAFDISFDPTKTYTDASGATLTGINIAEDYPLLFNYDPTTNLLTVGGSSDGAASVFVSPPTNAFYLRIKNFTGPTRSLDQFGYVQTSPDEYFYTTASTGAFTVTPNMPVTSAVPEPTSWAMMIGGFGTIGGTMRRRKGSGFRLLAA